MIESETKVLWTNKPDMCHPALEGKSGNYTSQFGEDGLIAAALELVGVEHKWCFEVGAADGLFFSNTKVLRDAGWWAVLVEKDSFHFDKLKRWESGKVHTRHETVGPAVPIDGILWQHDVPEDLELVVIDIDGQDYYVWGAMTLYRPRLVLIEFAPNCSQDFLPLPGAEGQAGLQPILALGREKGYVTLAKTYCNVLFAAEEYLE
ncbi:hypothetical protein LCGC14_1201100 [marine sediment metagenome]|uniref:Methyltransferase FkbM domain-containing protein n=1 Tax=marine sediment metagenome TaxID=412755 RepID=A0A0F9M480_9ZZZZ